MGACCTKTLTSTPTPPDLKIKPNPQQPHNNNNNAIAASPTQQQPINKDLFMLKHRKSHEIDQTRKSIDRNKTPNTDISLPVATNSAGDGGVLNDESGKVLSATVRTSSCTKEELDAILIQCGRLSRSSSGVKPAGGETPTRGRRYSGSKRSFDFDMENGSKNDDDVAVVQREVRVSSPGSRRRSRERSGSKERGSGNGGGRVSRSPNRRSESPNPNSNATAAAGGGGTRPGKMVSVPATDKGSNAGGGEKKIQVKRNAGEAVIAAGCRSRSPAGANLKVLNENQNAQAVTLSRSNSRKGEHSPYRRNPLGEIDTNVVGSEQPGSKKPNGEKMMNNKANSVKNSLAKEGQMLDETKTNQIVSRTRSARLSRDLDISPETLISPSPNPPSYASLLLKDIQTFHQQNSTTAATPVAAAPLADLKSTTSSSVWQNKKEDLVESEKVVNDDLMEPSLHKYVTVRRGGDADNEDKESSGSNSFAGSQQLSWMSSSWEPNSGDSTDCWTSKSRSDARDMGVERSNEYPRNGIGRGRVGANGRSAYSLPNNATFAST